ncbi:unnamed protein product, partial [Mesorhabditis spiculigera]
MELEDGFAVSSTRQRDSRERLGDVAFIYGDSKHTLELADVLAHSQKLQKLIGAEPDALEQLVAEQPLVCHKSLRMVFDFIAGREIFIVHEMLDKVLATAHVLGVAELCIEMEKQIELMAHGPETAMIALEMAGHANVQDDVAYRIFKAMIDWALADAPWTHPLFRVPWASLFKATIVWAHQNVFGDGRRVISHLVDRLEIERLSLAELRDVAELLPIANIPLRQLDDFAQRLRETVEFYFRATGQALEMPDRFGVTSGFEQDTGSMNSYWQPNPNRLPGGQSPEKAKPTSSMSPINFMLSSPNTSVILPCRSSSEGPESKPFELDVGELPPSRTGLWEFNGVTSGFEQDTGSMNSYWQPNPNRLLGGQSPGKAKPTSSISPVNFMLSSPNTSVILSCRSSSEEPESKPFELDVGELPPSRTGLWEFEFLFDGKDLVQNKPVNVDLDVQLEKPQQP